MKNTILFIYISLTIFSTAFAQWQPDVRLTNDPAQSYMSGPHQHDIASNGNVLHVVWHDQRTNWDIYYKRSTDAGISWSADTRLSNGPAESHSASVAVSGSVVIVVWNDSRDGHWELFYMRSTDGGISWGTETRLTANDSFSSSNPVAASIGSVFHLIWEDGRDGNEEIYYKRSTDGGLSWSTDVRLTNNTAVSYSPSITVSGSVLHVVWYDDRDGNNEIYYKRSTDGGISWGADTRLSSTPYVSEATTVAASGSNVHVVWADERDGNREIYYKRSSNDGLNWETDFRLTNNTGYSEAPSITVSGSNVHVAWQDNRDGNFEVYYKRSTDGGTTWGPDTRLTNAPGNSLRTFSTVSGTAVHVVWMDERDGNWEIYYKRDPTGNPLSVPPSPPNLISPPNGSYNEPSSVRFIWNRPLSAVTYRIQIALDSLFTNMIYNDSTLTDSTIVVANLTVDKYYWWRVNAKNAFGTSQYSDIWIFGTFPVGLKGTGTDIPDKFMLYNNYPNPFNPVSKIRFDIAKTGNVILKVYDMRGQEISTLVNGQLKPGTYEAEFDGSNYSSGVYFYGLETADFAETKKMVLIK
jgi:Secretion system C-terminal sorting domain/BNR repeat-like domain